MNRYSLCLSGLTRAHFLHFSNLIYNERVRFDFRFGSGLELYLTDAFNVRASVPLRSSSFGRLSPGERWAGLVKDRTGTQPDPASCALSLTQSLSLPLSLTLFASLRRALLLPLSEPVFE